MEVSVDLTRPVDQIAVAMLFLVPGLITTWVMERLVGRTTLSGSERLLRAVAWSLLAYFLSVLWMWPVIHSILDHDQVRASRLILSLAATLFLVPLALGVAVARIRQLPFTRDVLSRLTSIHPAPSAWDFVFAQRRAQFVRIRLKDGTLIGGLYSDGSFASSYPEPQDLFLEQAWRLDPNGPFGGPIPRSRGVLVREDSWAVVEFLEAEEEKSHGEAR